MTSETRRFLVGLGAIVAVGLVVRLAFMLLAHHPYDPHGDALVYHAGANDLAEGKGFVLAFFLENGEQQQAASNPPLYLIWLAIPSLFGLDSPLAHQLWSFVLGLGTIVVIGFLARKLAGNRAGLIAAAIAAIGPNFFYWDTVILAETMSLLAASAVVYLAYRAWQSPDTKRLVLLGAACGAAALARAELTLLVPLVVVPLALGRKTVDRGARVRRLAAAGLAALIVVTPWIAYNATRFEKTVLLSNGLGVTLAATQCDTAFYGELTGLWSVDCSLKVQRTFPKGFDESQRDAAYRDAAFEYLGDHLDRFPVVVLARWTRALGIYDLGYTLKFEQFPEGRDKTIAYTGMLSVWILGILSFFGVRELRRRKIPVYPLVALPVIAMIAIAIAFASARYRSTAEPALAVLGAIAIDAFIRRGRGEADQPEGALVDAGAASS